MPIGDAKLLLEQAVKGEINAIGILFEQARPLLKGKLLKLIRNESEVDDLLSETFLKICSAIKGFRGDSKPSSWFYRVAINTHFDDLRRKKPHPHDTIDGSFPEEQVRSPLENPEAGRTKRGGRIERYSAFRVDQNEADQGSQHEENRREESKEILRRALQELTVREQEALKRIYFSRKRVPAEQLVEEMGFASRGEIYEIARKFRKLCFKAREEVLRSRKVFPPDQSP